jgi:hypothetical protein
MEKYKHSTFDTAFLISGKGATFIGASIISAIINLIFIGNLSNDSIHIGPIEFPPAILMIAISLTLEASKLLHVIQYNTLNELARKLADAPAAIKIKQVARKWFIGYLMYAALAIIASVNFSVGNLGKSNTATNATITVAQTYYNSWNEEQAKIDDLTKQLTSISSDAKTEWQTQVDAHQAIPAEEFSIKPESARVTQWKAYRDKIRGAINYVSESAILSGGKTLDKYISYLQKDVNSQLEAANQSLSDIKSEAAKAGYNSYISLKTAQTTLEANKIVNSGSQASFEIFANLLHVNVEGFRTVMLLILSLLIELTIYQTSPKVQINRRMLYQFTEYLPANFNVNKFMDSVDKELIAYDMIKTDKKTEVAMNKQDIELERAKKEAEKAELKRKAAEARREQKIAEKAAKKAEEPLKEEHIDAETPKAPESPALVTIPQEVDLTPPIKEDTMTPSDMEIAAPVKKARKAHAKKAKKVEITSEQKQQLIALTKKITDDKKEAIENETNNAIKDSTSGEQAEVATVETGTTTREVLEPVVEKEQSSSQPDNEPSEVKKDEIQVAKPVQMPYTIPYRLGRTTERVKDKFVALVRRIYDGAKKDGNYYVLNDVYKSAEEIGIGAKDRDIILNRLLDMKYGEKREHILFIENDVLKSPFECEEFISWITKVVE